MSPWAWSPDFLPRGRLGRLMLAIIVLGLTLAVIGLAVRAVLRS